MTFFRRLSSKSIETQEQDFISLVSALKPKSKESDIIECAIAYISEFYEVEPRKLVQYPLKSYAETFIDYSLPYLIQGIVTREDNRILLQTYSSITCFMPLNKDYTKLLYQLLLGLSSSHENNIDQYALKILRNILSNKPFLAYCSEIEIFRSIYKIAQAKDSQLLLDFLYNVIILSKKICDLDLSNDMKTATGQQLNIIVALQVKQGRNLDLKNITQSILTCQDCTCLIEVYKKDNKSVFPIIEQILKNPTTKLLESFLKITNFIPNVTIELQPFFDNLSIMQINEQISFINYLYKQEEKVQNKYLKLLMQPWKYLTDCECLNKALVPKLKSDLATQYLNHVLLEGNKNDLKQAFENVKHFNDFIIALIHKADNYNSTSIYFDRIVSLISQGCSNGLEVIFSIIKTMPFVTFKNSLIANMSVLCQQAKFVDTLPSLLLNPEEVRELICSDFIELIIDLGLVDALAALAINGPYAEIDKVVLHKFEKSSLAKMSELELKKLAHALPQSAQSISGPLRIPSLITKITSIELATYYDVLIAGKYLLENDLVNIDSPVINLIGTQYLTTQLASELISRPDILLELTSPDFPHKDTYQIDGSKPNSYISYLDSPVTIEFRVEACYEKIIILHFFETTVEYFNSELYIGDIKLKCLGKQWHKIFVNYENEMVNLHLDDKDPIQFHLNQWFLTIGSMKTKGKGIFYVKKMDFGKVNDGVYIIKYRGFTYHAPFIHALQRIYDILIKETDRNRFKDYFEILFNLQISMKIDVFKCIGMIRIILINKGDFVTKDLIDMSLNYMIQNGKVNWDIFEMLFLDYNLWYKAVSIMDNVAQFIIDWFKVGDSSKLSLLHFFLDLIVFGNIVSPQVVKVVGHLCKIYQQFNMTGDILYNILNKNLIPQVKSLFKTNKKLLSTIPLIYISQLEDDLAIQYFTEYSIKCIFDDVYDFDALKTLIPFIASISGETSVWVALFTLLTNKAFKTVPEYSVCDITRPEMLHIIFNLICDLYEQSDKHAFLIQVVDCLDTLIKQNNANLVPYFDEIRFLIHLGQTTKTNYLQPICFGNQFEPCRMPTEEAERHLTCPPHDQNYFKSLSSKEFLVGTDQWFGDISLSYTTNCDKLLEDIHVDNTYKPVNDSKPMAVKESSVFRLIVDIIQKFLLQLNSNDIKTYFPQLLNFGMNVDSQLSIAIHQSVILNYIAATSPDINALIFIEKMVCAGWWENRKNELFNIICMQYERPYNTIDSWNAFGELIISIMCITEDFNKLHINKSTETLFNQNLLKNKQYFFCMLHFLASDDLQQQINSSLLNEIWIKFLEKSAEIDLTYYFGEVFNSTDPILVSKNFIDLSRNTNYFQKNNTISNNVKQLANNQFNDYIRVKALCLSSIYQEISYNRFKNHVNRPSRNLTHMLYQSKCIRFIEKYAFQTRYNIISLRNEQNAFRLWTLLPQDLPKAYQIAPSVHPISAPSLYIPFVSKIDLNKYNEYKMFQSDSTVFGGISIQNSLIPRCIDSFVSVPFFEIDESLHDYLFQLTYKEFGKITKIQQISILYSSILFDVLFVRGSNGFYFIINAVLKNNKIVLKSHKEQESILAYSTFSDALANGYYGPRSLFLGHVVLECTHHDVMISCQRVYLKEPRAIEIWFSRGFSLFLVFENKEIATLSHTYFKMPVFFPDYDSHFSVGFSNKLCKLMNDKKAGIMSYTNKWVQNQMSSFIYLLILNFLSDRSFSNLSQYPIMPWVHPDRDLSKPMGQQTERRARKFQEKYDEDICSIPFFYGSTYSTPGDVFRLLVRIHPYTIFHIDLNKGFGVEERNFVDIETEWKKSSGENDQNVEELIPEFFCVPEIFTNSNSIPIKSMSDFKLPDGNDGVVDFTSNFRERLETTSHLHEWIDLIFGSKVQGQAAIAAKNIFLPTFYGVATERWDETIIDTMMTEFGVAPTSLFTANHPQRSNLYKKDPQLSDSETFFMQRLNSTLELEPSPDLYLECNENGFFFSDPKIVIRKYLKDFKVNDGILSWKWSLDELQCCKFSSDGIMFAAAVNPGAFVVYRLIYKSKKEHGEIVFIGCYFVPACYLSDKIACCDISSHLSLLVAASGRDVFCFHISSKKFIRQICFRYELNNVLISNTFNMIYGVGKNSIEAFTINGTEVASGNCDEDIICSAISHNDSSFYLATGHKSGKINIWKTNIHEKKIYLTNPIIFSDYSISAVSILGNGSNMFVADASRCCSMVAAAEAGKCLVDISWVDRCANCKRKPKKYSLCSQCGLYYCKNCIDKNAKPVCKLCLQYIAEQVDI